jgi:hypothetical protein
MPEEILPHPIHEKSGDETGNTPCDIEQRELFSHLKHLAWTAIPGTLLHLDPLRLIQFE